MTRPNEKAVEAVSERCTWRFRTGRSKVGPDAARDYVEAAEPHIRAQVLRELADDLTTVLLARNLMTVELSDAIRDHCCTLAAKEESLDD